MRLERNVAHRICEVLPQRIAFLPIGASRPPTRAGTAYLATVCPPMPTVGAGSSQREDSPAHPRHLAHIPSHHHAHIPTHPRRSHHMHPPSPLLRRTIAVPSLVHPRISSQNPNMKRRRYGDGTTMVRSIPRFYAPICGRSRNTQSEPDGDEPIQPEFAPYSHGGVACVLGY